MPNPDRKLYVPDKILGCLYTATQEFTWKKYLVRWFFVSDHTDLSKEAYAENLAKIAAELRVLDPI